MDTDKLNRGQLQENKKRRFTIYQYKKNKSFQ